MVAPFKQGGSPPLVLQTLQWLRKNEFKPVPLVHQSKAAISKDYAEPGYKPPTDAFWQARELGIGVLTGPAAGGPIDVDLDCPEAVFFAPRFLPPTQAIFGRASKPASHYLYRVNAMTLEKVAYNDPVNKSDSTIVEIRGDGGHQTVMPGSLHADTGELVEWATVPFPEVPLVEPDVLSKAVRKIAIATLITRHLWNPGERNQYVLPLSGMFMYLDWDPEEAWSVINAVMDWWQDPDIKTRRPTVLNAWKNADRGRKVTGATTLRRLCGNDLLIDRLLELAGSPGVNVLQEYNERFAVVTVEGKFRVADTDQVPGRPPVLFQKDDFLNLMGNDFMQVEGKYIPKAKSWLSNARRRTYRGIEFLPGVEDPPGVLNLWNGWHLEPKPGDCSGWLELLQSVVCGGDPTLTSWMLHWFANIFREPMAKPLTAPVIIGKQGAGKSLLLNYIGRILGPAYTVITNEEHVYGRFNQHLATTLLMHSEEALYGGEKRHRGIIKSLITDEHRIFEQKGVDARQVRNFLRLVLTSNEAHAAPAEPNDRRFTVVDLQERRASQELIGRILAELNGDGPAALFDYLLKMDYDPSIPRNNIKNESLATLKGINMAPVESWWMETLTAGFVLPDYLAWAQHPKEQPWPQIVSSSALFLSMSLKLRSRGARAIPNETSFAYHLDRFLGTKLRRKQKYFSNPLMEESGAPREARELSERHSTITNLPDLTTARQSFSLYVGQDLEWPDEMDEEEKPVHERY